MKRHLFHPEAEQEYSEAARFYARINPELGGRFYDEIERFQISEDLFAELGVFREDSGAVEAFAVVQAAEVKGHKVLDLFVASPAAGANGVARGIIPCHRRLLPR